MTIINRRTFGALALAAGTFLAAATTASAADKIKVGILSLTSHAPSIIAEGKGYFDEQNLDVDFVMFQAAQPMAVAIASGDVDFGMTAMSGGLVSLAEKGDVRWEGTVMAANHALSRAEQKVAADPGTYALEWDEAGRELHASFVAACGSPRLIDTQARLYNQSRRFRLADLREGGIDFAASRRSHDAVVTAIIARDAAAAAAALANDIRGALVR